MPIWTLNNWSAAMTTSLTGAMALFKYGALVRA